MKKICGIYKITSPKKKIYIGQSIDCNKRKIVYEKLRCKSQKKIYNSILKYGWSSHSFEIIHQCKSSELNGLEAYYVDLFQSFNSKDGLNLMSGGGAGRLCSSETKLKIRNSRLGEKNWNYGKKRSAETKIKISNSHKGIAKGRVASKETRIKMSQGRKGKNNPFFSKKHTEQSRLKISKANKGENNYSYGKHVPDERRKKIGNTLKNNKTHWCYNEDISKKVKKRLSEVNRGRKFRISDEALKNNKGKRGKIIINISNGIFYFGAKSACDAYGNQSLVNFQRKINNKIRNNTDFRYADEASISIAINPYVKPARFHSDETKKKLSISRKGIILSKETKLRIGMSNKGKLLGRKVPEEVVRKLTQLKIGKKVNGKLVLNMESGIFYKSIREAWNSYGVGSESNFREKIVGIKLNTTSFIQVK